MILRQINLKRLCIQALPYLLFAYFGNKIAWLYRISPGEQPLYKLIFAVSNLKYAFQSILPSLYYMDLLFGVCFSLCIRLVIYARSKNAKSIVQGRNTVLPDGEHGKILNRLSIQIFTRISP